MSSTGVELVDLVARWVHLIAGVMWIGNSLLFNWLDRNLQRTDTPKATPDPIGNIWLLHSGAFYFMEKTLLGGAAFPARLHWFKYQAYATWWSGLVLLLAVYWVGGRAALADPGRAGLTHTEAVLLGAGAIVGGWLLYEAMQRLVAPRAPGTAALVWVTGLGGISLTLIHMLNGRAAFLHVGAMLGTLMAANVFFTIIPSQRALVDAVRRGGAGSDALSARAKRVSIHNNYFTFPVIILMLIGHFPSVYSHPQSPHLLAVLIAGGVLVRHVLNIRFEFSAWRPALAASIVGTVGGLLLLLRAGSGEIRSDIAVGIGSVEFGDVRHVIDRRCGSCHSFRQSDPSFGPAPGGVVFDTQAEIEAYRGRILARAVITRTMPPANKTMMTDGERELLGRWGAGQVPR